MADKNIVIIGSGPAAADTANALIKAKLPSDYRIIVIGEVEFAYWPIGALRAAVQSGFEDKIVLPLEDFLSSPHIVLTGSPVVQLNSDSVVLDKPRPDKGFDSTTIPFAFAVVATGSIYPFPARPAPGARTIDEVKASFKNIQQDVASSESIVIVGGGPVGVEFAGEVKAVYPDKAITLVHRGSTLIGTDWNSGFTGGLLNQMQKSGVKVVLGESIDVSDRKTGKLPGGTELTISNGDRVQADFLLIAIGNKANTALVESLAPSTLSPETKRVKVKQTFQIDTSDGSLSNMYVVGDACDSPELKLVAATPGQAAQIATSIMSQIRNTAQPQTYKPLGQLMLVTYGPKGGAGQLYGRTVGAFLTSVMKSGHLFLSAFNDKYNVKDAWRQPFSLALDVLHSARNSIQRN